MNHRDVVVEAQGVGVQFVVQLTRRRTLRHSIADRLTGRATENKRIWALRNVSFKVERGECVGVIGPNGAGKSTLLLTIARIIRPDTGRMMVNGRVSPLLTLGAGFDPDLTGRDNIFLNAAFLGLSRRVIRQRLDDIIAFADLGAFIDAPLRVYSSGMRSRLGFGIATHTDPELLLIDEILGAGDAAFKDKSRAKMQSLMQRATAIVIVTHNLGFVRNFCSRALLLGAGELVEMGSPEEITQRYMASVQARTKAPVPKTQRRAAESEGSGLEDVDPS